MPAITLAVGADSATGQEGFFISGTGFSPGGTVSIVYIYSSSDGLTSDSGKPARTSVDPSGSFSTIVDISTLTNIGSLTVEAADNSGQTATAGLAWNGNAWAPSPWVDNNLTGFTQGIPAAPGSALDGYWGSDGSQHVNFIDNNGHVHELYIRSGANWVDNDLIVLSASRSAARKGTLHAYWGSDGSQHVNFVDSDGNVHELYIR